MISILKDKLDIYGVRIFQAVSRAGKVMKERKLNTYMFVIH